MHLRRALVLSASVIAIACATAQGALAADPYYAPIPAQLPAVSAVNGKLGLFGGSLSGDGAFGATGSLAIPLHGQFGAQFDGLVGTSDSNTFYGVGGHLFWRDPSAGLLGGYASYVGWGDGVTTTGGGNGGLDPLYSIGGANVGKVGVEAEAYLGRLSLEAVGAYQFGTFTGFTGRATIAYYASDDLRLDIGYDYLQGPGGAFTAGAEWQLPNSATTLFADASYKSRDAWSALGGIKVYFGGEQKSLIRRHREDDPENLLPGDLYKYASGAYCEQGKPVLDDGVLICQPK